MVRTTGGIRISAGKSSKKGGGSRSTPSTPTAKSNSKSTNRLPPIPHCEAPSWQKPITNFFNSEAGSSTSKDVEDGQNQEKEFSSHEDKGSSTETNADIDSVTEHEQVPEKRRKTSNEDAGTSEKNQESGENSVCGKNDIDEDKQTQKTRNDAEVSKENVDINILKS